MPFSNSPLVTYTNISPNKTSPRNHAIDTITIHCIVGQWTAKQGCDYFASTKRNASCNYVVGKDGSIGLCVPERDRSWCSSNADNDNRAITIEVASDTSHPYAVTGEAYNALIALCEDVCRRNNIEELKWVGDKTLVGQVDKQNMTVHRWFANKACPGEYLYSHHNDIVMQVNARLLENSSPKDADYAPTIWSYFLNKLGNKYGVAGLMGNLYAESGLKPNNLQNSFESVLGHDDESYTASVDDGTYSEAQFVNDGAGYGLAQWTFSTRKQALYNMFKSGNYTSIGSISLALDFLWWELESNYPSVVSVLKNSKAIREASDVVLHEFERPADQSESVEEKREEYGAYYHNMFKDEASAPDNDYQQKLSKLSQFLMFAIATDDF